MGSEDQTSTVDIIGYLDTGSSGWEAIEDVMRKTWVMQYEGRTLFL